MLAAAGTTAQLTILEARRRPEAARVLVRADRCLLDRDFRSAKRVAVVTVVAGDSIPLLRAAEAFALVRRII